MSYKSKLVTAINDQLHAPSLHARLYKVLYMIVYSRVTTLLHIVDGGLILLHDCESVM